MNGHAISLPPWYLDYREAWKHVSHEESDLNTWQSAYDVLFEKTSVDQDEHSSNTTLMPIVIPEGCCAKSDAFETILKSNSGGLKLNEPLFHYTTFSNLNSALNLGGFVLSRPGTWSVNWEDTEFKNSCNKLKNDQAVEGDLAKKILNFFSRDSYAMCWTIDEDNPCVVDYVRRKHPSESIAVISTTVRQLLGAYINDNLSVCRCFLVKMEYLKEKKLRRLEVEPESLTSGDNGSEVHRQSVSLTADKFEKQHEVRLIVEDSIDYPDKTMIDTNNHMSGNRETHLVKHVNLSAIINSVRMIPNDYLFGCHGQGRSKRRNDRECCTCRSTPSPASPCCHWKNSECRATQF